MKKVLVFAGSSSKKSINKQLATYAAGLLKNSPYSIIDINDYPLPLFSIDLESDNGFPENAVNFSLLIEESCGIILSLAEHNGSYTAAFKNLFDWLSRIEPKTWRNKPMLILSTSPGARGGKSVLDAALARFPYHSAIITDSFSLPSFKENFKNGAINNKALNTLLVDTVCSFEKHLNT